MLNRRRTGISVTLATVLVAPLLAACGSDSDGATGGDGSGSLPEYTIGYVGATSGPVGASGRVAVDGLKAGIEYVNTLGIANFKMVTRDDGGDPNRGANLARELAQSGVDAIFAGTPSFAAMQPVANQYKVLIADSGGVTGVIDKIGTDRQFPWGFCPDTACGGPTVLPEIAFLNKADPGGTIGELSVDTAYGSGTSQLVKELLPKKFPDVKIVRASFPAGASSVVSQLSELRDQGATSLLTWTYGSDLVMVMQSLDRLGWYPYVVGPLGVGDPSVVASIPEKLKGKAIAGGIATTQVNEDPSVAASGLNKEFFDRYTKISGEDNFNGLSTVASYPFDWAVVLSAAIKATGSTDSTKLRDWLTEGHTIDTSEGPQKFGPNGEERIGTSVETTSVYDPTQPCTDGVCVAPKIG